MREGWTYVPFEEGLEKVIKTSRIASSDYMAKGKYPIVSQEEALISGFWDNYDDVYKIQHPVVIFGDHTRIIKFIDFNFVVGADGVKILSPISKINPKFFYYYLRWCNIPSLGYSRHYKLLKELQIPISPLAEQERIVAELDLLTGIIDKQKAQFKELDTLAQSIFYDMFGDPEENEKGWEKKALKDVCVRVTDGSHYSPKEDENGYYPMLSVKDMESNGFNYDKCKYINESDYRGLVANGCKPFVNDVLVAKDGSYLKTAFVQREEKEQAVLSSIAILTPRLDIINPEYLSFFFKIPFTKSLVEKHYLTGTAIKRVILKGFKVVKIPIPPLSLQQSFAQKIQSIESQKASINQSIDETQKLFDYTMDKYFG